MKWYLSRLIQWKIAFETLAASKLINLDNEPCYWQILDDINEIYKKNIVL